jgi:hypothetical protein
MDAGGRIDAGCTRPHMRRCGTAHARHRTDCKWALATVDLKTLRPSRHYCFRLNFVNLRTFVRISKQGPILDELFRKLAGLFHSVPL